MLTERRRILHKGLVSVTALLASGQILWSSQQGESTDTRLPVPYLNRDGSIPPENANRKVFLDPATGDVVVFFDTNSTSGQAKTERIPVELSRHTEPSARAEISYDSPSQEWQYEYTLINGASARQAASSWYFRGLTREMCSVSVPNHWYFLFPTALGNPDWPRLVVSASGPLGKDNPEIGVPPGKEVTGVVLRSKLAPGIGEMYVQGRSHIAAFPSEPDDVTAKQLIAVWGYPYNYRKTFTLMPKIEATDDKQRTSTKYMQELRLCKDDAQCSVEFFDAAAAFLTKVASDPIEQLSVQSVMKTAKLPLERELSKTFKLLFAKDDER